MSSQNQKLATLLTAIANLLASRGENQYRIRAYRRAAESVLQLTEDINAIAQRGELLTIPGIGKDLSSKIEEFLSSGSMRTYEELKSPLPLDVKTWVDLPGFSEPLVHDLYFRLRITTLEDLEQLVRSHLIRTLPGTIVHTEDVLQAIKVRRRKAVREPI
jgi:DNA polymerase (family 10)